MFMCVFVHTWELVFVVSMHGNVPQHAQTFVHTEGSLSPTRQKVRTDTGGGRELSQSSSHLCLLRAKTHLVRFTFILNFLHCICLGVCPCGAGAVELELR